MHGPVPIHANSATPGRSRLVVPFAGKGGLAGGFAVALSGALRLAADPDTQPPAATTSAKPTPQSVTPNALAEPVKEPARMRAPDRKAPAHDATDPDAVTVAVPAAVTVADQAAVAVADPAGKASGSSPPAQVKIAMQGSKQEAVAILQSAASQSAPSQAEPAAVSATQAVPKPQLSSDAPAVHAARARRSPIAPTSQPPPAPIAVGAPMIVPAPSTSIAATPVAATPVTESATQDIKAQGSSVIEAVPRNERGNLTEQAGPAPSPAMSPSTDGTAEKHVVGSASAPGEVEPAMTTDKPQAVLAGSGLSPLPVVEPNQPALSTTTAATAATTTSVIAAAPADQIAPALVEILNTTDGVQSVTVSLQPPELGQVQIRIDRSVDGATRVDITAERPETLQLLQRDQPRLEQVLDQAGVPANGRSVSFQVAITDQVSPSASRPDSLATGSGDGGRGQSGGAWRQSQDQRQDPGANPDPDRRQTQTRWFRAGLDITA